MGNMGEERRGGERKGREQRKIYCLIKTINEKIKVNKKIIDLT